MTVIDRARMFIVSQRINELKRSISYWPLSDKIEERKSELEDLEEEYKVYKLGSKAD